MFKLDSPLMNFLNKVADIMILNVIFMISCIPFVTIGASFSAAYYIGYKMVKDEESYIVKGFFKAFKENFKQATIIWLIVLAAISVIFLDYRIILYSGIGFPRWMIISMVTVTVVVLMGVVYMFALQARYTNTVKNTIKNSFLMALSHLPTTFLLIVIYAVPVVICYFIPRVFLAMFFISFGAVIYFKSFLLLKIFRKYEETLVDKDNEATESEEDLDGGIFAESDRIESEEIGTVDEENTHTKVFRDGRFIEVSENSVSDSEIK